MLNSEGETGMLGSGWQAGMLISGRLTGMLCFKCRLPCSVLQREAAMLCSVGNPVILCSTGESDMLCSALQWRLACRGFSKLFLPSINSVKKLNIK